MEWRPSPGTGTGSTVSREAYVDAARAQRLLLLEPRSDSDARERITRLASEVGLSVAPIDSIDQVPTGPSLLGIGPTMPDPVQVARRLRARGAQPLLVFFTASSAARNGLKAELLRDPFVCARYELIDLDSSARRLRSHFGRLLTRVTPHRGHGTSRRGRARAVRSTPRGASIQRTDQYLANVLDQANDAIFSTDAHGRLASWNRAAERLLGHPAERAVGASIELLDAPEAATERFSKLVDAALAAGEPTEEDACLLSADGQTVSARVSIAPVRDGRGRMLGLSLVARDMSERIRAEEALRDASRQKDEFLAIMSHELRTPLTSILGYTDMLLRGLSGPLGERTTKYVGNVRAAGDRLLELVNGLLDYTRLEAGVERIDLRPTDVAELVRRVAQPYVAQAENKGIELRIEADPVGKAEADPEKLEHVLRTYVGNALKFTPDDGSVTVRVTGDHESVCVAVTDSGIGLRDEQLARVWERFYQGDASLTRPYGGMGLGLSIARHLVLLHGGSVAAESLGPGRGSTFSFSLPRRHATEVSRDDERSRV